MDRDRSVLVPGVEILLLVRLRLCVVPNRLFRLPLATLNLIGPALVVPVQGLVFGLDLVLQDR